MPPSIPPASHNEIAISDRLIDHPVLLNEWHPSHNGMIRKDRLTSTSYRWVWWQHPAPLLSSSISTCTRAIASELHPTKNRNHSADTIPWNSAVLIWWQCSVDPTHEWEESPYERTREQPFHPCPFCTQQSTTGTKVEQRTPELPQSRLFRPCADSIQTTTLPKIKKPGKVLDLSRSRRDQLRCTPLLSASTATTPSGDRSLKSSVQTLTLTLVEARWTLNGPGKVHPLSSWLILS